MVLALTLYPGPLARREEGLVHVVLHVRINYLEIGVMYECMRNRRCVESQADSVERNDSKQLSCSADVCPVFPT